uniref:Ankyrin repeat domain 53 n=1 Tax=Terrapene triunguis TaxID=2587831 RepID=A0A674JQL4_9SAUR
LEDKSDKKHLELSFASSSLLGLLSHPSSSSIRPAGVPETGREWPQGIGVFAVPHWKGGRHQCVSDGLRRRNFLPHLNGVFSLLICVALMPFKDAGLSLPKEVVELQTPVEHNPVVAGDGLEGTCSCLSSPTTIIGTRIRNDSLFFSQNQGGTSPLHKAASEGRLNCIIELVEAGADVHAKDAEGQQPIDLCRIWAHRSCARYLSDAMWKTDKRNFAREMHKLNQLKSECQRLTWFCVCLLQREQELLNTVAFSNWLRMKQQQQLPDSAKRMHFPEDRAKLDAVPKKEVAKTPPGEKKSSVHAKRRAKVKGEPRLSAPAQPPPGKSQRAWNASVNPSSPLVTDIFRPTTVRLGTDPEACGDHDFSSFLFLSKDSHGQPVIEMAYNGRLSPIPNLPYEVIERSLYPHARPIRVTMPQGFKPTHIFDVKRKRLPSLEHRWTDEMAMSLRETLDPAIRVFWDYWAVVSRTSLLPPDQ